MTKRILLMAAAVAAASFSGNATPTGSLRCTLTGKVINSCCCVRAQNGNLHCTLAKKDIKNCCCEPTQPGK